MRLKRALLAATLLAVATSAPAHAPGLDRWPAAPWLASVLLASVGAWGLGVLRAPRGAIGEWWRTASGAIGWLALALALLSPLDPLSDVLFAAHMAQHEALMLVAAPLLVIGRPLAVVPWALPSRARVAVASLARTRAVRTPWTALTHPVTAWALHAIALWAWHVPRLFDAALLDERVHFVQHATFFWTAALFWWAVVHGRYGRFGYGLAALSVFTTSLHGGALGALLTLAPRVEYAVQAHRAALAGADPLADQQVAGLLMWIPFGVVFVLMGIALVAAWLGDSERRARHGIVEQALR